MRHNVSTQSDPEFALRRPVPTVALVVVDLGEGVFAEVDLFDPTDLSGIIVNELTDATRELLGLLGVRVPDAGTPPEPFDDTESGSSARRALAQATLSMALGAFDLAVPPGHRSLEIAQHGAMLERLGLHELVHSTLVEAAETIVELDREGRSIRPDVLIELNEIARIVEAELDVDDDDAEGAELWADVSNFVLRHTPRLSDFRDLSEADRWAAELGPIERVYLSGATRAASRQPKVLVDPERCRGWVPEGAATQISLDADGVLHLRVAASRSASNRSDLQWRVFGRDDATLLRAAPLMFEPGDDPGDQHFTSWLRLPEAFSVEQVSMDVVAPIDDDYDITVPATDIALLVVTARHHDLRSGDHSRSDTDRSSSRSTAAHAWCDVVERMRSDGYPEESTRQVGARATYLVSLGVEDSAARRVRQLAGDVPPSDRGPRPMLGDRLG